ncbi:hypothetical protein KSW81_006713 [Nannochloris sp. 'desiccata']|nr:hypothetical protein KSW81_006713 [Chlorella desiccata (nom. nud.)]
MSNLTKPSGVINNLGNVAKSQHRESAATYADASDLMTVSDLLRALGMSNEQIASVPALRSLAGLNICAVSQNRAQPARLVSKSIWGAHFPDFCRRMAPQAPTATKPAASQCAPARSLPTPVSLGPAQSNIKSANGLIKNIRPATSASASAAAATKPAAVVENAKQYAPLRTLPVPASLAPSKANNPANGLTKTSIQSLARAGPSVAAAAVAAAAAAAAADDSKSAVPVKAPAAAPPSKLGPAFDEAAPSWYNPGNYGPFSTWSADELLSIYKASDDAKRVCVKHLERKYLESKKEHVALNGLKGKEKLEVPAHIAKSMNEKVYGIAAPKQLATVKIKSTAAVAKKHSTPITPTTPVTPVIEAQTIRAPLESQDSIRSTPDSSDSASVASQEKIESPLVAEDPSAAKDSSMTKTAAFAKVAENKEVTMSQIFVIPAVDTTIFEDEEPGCFYCATYAKAAVLVMELSLAAEGSSATKGDSIFSWEATDAERGRGD